MALWDEKQRQAVRSRPEVRSKFFFVEGRKWRIQGVTYGPLCPRPERDGFLGDPETARRDFAAIRDGGFNTLRIYHVPPAWFLDLAMEHGLRVLVTVPWHQRVLFLDNRSLQRQIIEGVRRAVRCHSKHPAILGYYVDNELPADLVRWYGPRRIEVFLNRLIETVKEEDPTALAAYANFPPTEFLLPIEADFFSYNVYLHDRVVLRSYLNRLMNLSEDRPLVLGEFGMDTLRHSEIEQADLLESHVEEVLPAGLAGTIVFAWTDEWFTNGIEVEDWCFGVVDRKRRPKMAYERLANRWLRRGERLMDKFPLVRFPRVSVVVCSYNGGSTLRECLESLKDLAYPDYEVIVVDDGSTDHTQEILRDFPWVVQIKQPNLGLSVARNVGLARATGEVVAYTDSDCMADVDWLYHLVRTLVMGEFAAVGGPNISPPPAQWVQATVAAAPGSPSHVLLTDTEAEHVPGCNMAFWKWVLEEIGGFDPEFRKAGDDVDVCWRVMQAGHRIGFSAGAVVWHHRRFTVGAYFNQQKGYGEAEAMLRFKHLAFFQGAGNARWRGRIYGQPREELPVVRPVIYHGMFGTGFFQSIYARSLPDWMFLVSSLEWHAIAGGVLLVGIVFTELRLLPLVMWGMSLFAAIHYMFRMRLDRRYDRLLTRLLLFFLAYAQPLVRGYARYFTWLKGKRTPAEVSLHPENLPRSRVGLVEAGLLKFWSEGGLDRESLLKSTVSLLEEEGWNYALDTGWTNWDVQVFANRWWHVRLRTMTEVYPQGRRLTRVKVTPVVSMFSWMMLLVLALATVAAILTLERGWMVAILVVFLLVFGWLGSALFLRQRVAHVVEAAARRRGLSAVTRV